MHIIVSRDTGMVYFTHLKRKVTICIMDPNDGTWLPMVKAGPGTNFPDGLRMFVTPLFDTTHQEKPT